jgi:hypothetical protein
VVRHAGLAGARAARRGGLDVAQPARVLAHPPKPKRRRYRVAVVASEPDPKAAAAVLRWLAARLASKEMA